MGHPSVGATIDLRIALKPDRENALVDTLYEIITQLALSGYPILSRSHAPAESSPSLHLAHNYIPPFLCRHIYSRVNLLLHYRYGARLSKEQVADLKLVAPYRDTRKIVESRLEHYVPPPSVSTSHGGPSARRTNFTGTPGTNETILRTVRYALPTALHGLVKTVAPTTFFGSPRTLRQTSRKRSGGGTAPLSRRDETDEAVTPSYLRSLYMTSTYRPAAWT
ncbi:hypothetical protein EDB85DRAFT_2139710 [Lactarius pseudohatsudake]|nr:hypothetical protein EDB85DRAFT_2139710 [Lactarius pseudohatsudake]